MRRHMLLGLASSMLLPVGSVQAQLVRRPLLTVSGPNALEATYWTEEEFAELPFQDIHTTTQWTEGVQHFRGPLLRDVLLAHVPDAKDIRARGLRLTAINDFRIDFPAVDAWDFDCILARERNGVPMRIRDKGPLWLVYPRDSDQRLQDPLRDGRWVWQLSQIEII